jgi:hypothetical protein
VLSVGDRAISTFRCLSLFPGRFPETLIIVAPTSRWLYLSTLSTFRCLSRFPARFSENLIVVSPTSRWFYLSTLSPWSADKSSEWDSEKCPVSISLFNTGGWDTSHLRPHILSGLPPRMLKEWQYLTRWLRNDKLRIHSAPSGRWYYLENTCGTTMAARQVGSWDLTSVLYDRMYAISHRIFIVLLGGLEHRGLIFLTTAYSIQSRAYVLWLDLLFHSKILSK